MCDSAAIYQLRFATASERRFCLAVVAKPCKIIAQQSRSWIFTLQFFEVKLRWFLTPSSANSAQLYSFCFPPSHNGVSLFVKLHFGELAKSQKTGGCHISNAKPKNILKSSTFQVLDAFQICR